LHIFNILLTCDKHWIAAWLICDVIYTTLHPNGILDNIWHVFVLGDGNLSHIEYDILSSLQIKTCKFSDHEVDNFVCWNNSRMKIHCKHVVWNYTFAFLCFDSIILSLTYQWFDLKDTLTRKAFSSTLIIPKIQCVPNCVLGLMECYFIYRRFGHYHHDVIYNNLVHMACQYM
jgi:hypothetical protein